MKVKTFNISLPEELVQFIDMQARLTFSTRSAYIRQVLVKKFQEKGILHEILPENEEETLAKLNRNKLKRYLASMKLKNEELHS